MFRTTLTLLALSLAVGLAAQDFEPEHYKALRYRHIGPVGNRTISIAGIAGDETTYYAGAASGGIWKTVDGGLKWKP